MSDTARLSAEQSLSLFQLLATPLRHRGLIVRSVVVVSVILVGFTLLKSRTYTATASFMPQTSESPVSRYAGIAAQFGIALPTANAGQSPAFYADLVRSEEILGQIVESTFVFRGPSGFAWFRDTTLYEADLVTLYGYDPDSASYRANREKAIGDLLNNMIVRTRFETGVVTVEVRARWPELAQQIAKRLLEQVSVFDQYARRSQAAAERQFIEQRLDEVRGELREAEDSLEVFLQQNRRFANSPTLVFEHDRLQWIVAMRQGVVSSLTQAHEQAKIEEVRDTPVITVLEPARLPARPDRRGTLLIGALSVVLGTVLGILGGFAREFVAERRVAEGKAYEHFAAHRAESLAELKSLFDLRWVLRRGRVRRTRSDGQKSPTTL